jgi:hypothetical protein
MKIVYDSRINIMYILPKYQNKGIVDENFLFGG